MKGKNYYRYRHEFIKRNQDKLTEEEMAQILNVAPITVKRDKKKIRESQPSRPTQEENVANNLPPITDKMIKKIMGRVKEVGECWEMSNDEVMVNGIWYSCKRILYYYYKGSPIDFDKIWVYRTCDNPDCVNPKHMRGKIKETGKRAFFHYDEEVGRKRLTLKPDFDIQANTNTDIYKEND